MLLTNLVYFSVIVSVMVVVTDCSKIRHSIIRPHVIDDDHVSLAVDYLAHNFIPNHIKIYDGIGHRNSRKGNLNEDGPYQQ